MRRMLLTTGLSVAAMACTGPDAESNEVIAGADEAIQARVVAAQDPWESWNDDSDNEPGLGGPDDSDSSGPWRDPPLTSAGTQHASGGSPRYDFEGSTQGWAPSGLPIVGVESSTQQRASGRASLAVDINGAGGAMVRISNPPLRAGVTVSFRLFVPAGSRLKSVQPFLTQDQTTNWKWTGNVVDVADLRPNAWNTVTVKVPYNARAFAALGVQLETAGYWRGRIYIDDIRF